MQIALRLMAVCIAFSGLGLVAGADEPKPQPVDDAKKQLGERTIAILTGATRVQTFLIDGEERGDKKKVDPANAIGGFEITKTGKELDKEFAAKVARTLLDDKTYAGESFKCFQPGVAFRVWNGKESVELIVCYRCENLHIVARDEKGKEIKSAWASFGTAKGNYPELVKLAKEAFPDEKAIEELPDRSRVRRE